MVVDLDVEFDVAGVHTGDSNVDAVGLTGIRQFVLKPTAREDPGRSPTQCVPNTKRPPRRNQETASKPDAMTTICVSKRSSPASLRRPPSSPVRRACQASPPCVDVSLHLYGHQYSPTDARSLRPPYFHQQTPPDHEACCLTCLKVGAPVPVSASSTALCRVRLEPGWRSEYAGSHSPGHFSHSLSWGIPFCLRAISADLSHEALHFFASVERGWFAAFSDAAPPICDRRSALRRYLTAGDSGHQRPGLSGHRVWCSWTAAVQPVDDDAHYVACH